MNGAGECPECGSATETRELGSSIGTFCARCHWSVVTTNLHTPSANELIDVDFYPIKEPLSEQQVKLISRLSGMKEDEVRHRSQFGGRMLRSTAVEVEKISEPLDRAGIAYMTSQAEGE